MVDDSAWVERTNDRRRREPLASLLPTREEHGPSTAGALTTATATTAVARRAAAQRFTNDSMIGSHARIRARAVTSVTVTNAAVTPTPSTRRGVTSALSQRRG